jgi:hypothetical protein
MKQEFLRYLDCLKLLFMVTTLVMADRSSLAQTCGQAYLQTCAISAGLSKCGFNNACAGSTTLYLHQAYTQTASATNDGGLPWEQTSSWSISETDVQNPFNNCGNTTNSYSGEAEYMDSSGGSTSATMDPITGNWSDGGTAYTEALTVEVGCWEQDYDSGDATNTDTCSSTTDEDAAGGYADFGDTIVSMTVTTTYMFSQPYTDDVLIANIKTATSVYPTNWLSGCGAAFWQWGNTNHSSAAGGKMKYRFYLTNTQLHQTYKIKWHERTTYLNGALSSQNMSEEVAGNGDPVNGVYSSTREVAMPTAECKITEVEDSVTVVSSGQGGS